MLVYRIVQNRARTHDLSGTGAFQYGGRWNNKGTYMLYTSENSSLAYLESIVHFDPVDLPPNLFILTIEVKDRSPLYTVPDSAYPPHWLEPALHENKELGDKYMAEQKYIGIKVRSAVNTIEYNCLLNPLFPGFKNLVTVVAVHEVEMDRRLRK